MDALDFTKAPATFREVQWVSNIFLLGMAGGWLLCYGATIRTALRDRVCWFPLVPLSCNLAWEGVFVFLYPPPRFPIVTAWFSVNLLVVYVTLRFGPSPSGNSPLRRSHHLVIFILWVALWAVGHAAFATLVHPLAAFYYGGLVCLFMTSATALCQLLDRGYTQGASYTIL